MRYLVFLLISVALVACAVKPDTASAPPPAREQQPVALPEEAASPPAAPAAAGAAEVPPDEVLLVSTPVSVKGAIGVQDEGSATGQARSEDTVARLLREAAEQEQDPQRREALWKQYQAYLEEP